MYSTCVGKMLRTSFVIRGYLSCVLRTGAPLLYPGAIRCCFAVCGVGRTRAVAFWMLGNFACALPQKQVQTQSCSVGVLRVLMASVQHV